MRTPAQLEAARRNGARSSGPKTAEGKARSSRNAITHGLRSEYLIVDGEVASGYYDLFDNLVAKFKPADEVEFSFIEQMAVAQWRQQRAWTIETATLNRQLQSPFQSQQADSGVGLLSAAFCSLANHGKELSLLLRYQAHYERSFQRALQHLLQLRKEKLPNEPEPPASPVAEPPVTEPSPPSEPPPPQPSEPLPAAANTPDRPPPDGRRLFLTTTSFLDALRSMQQPASDSGPPTPDAEP